MIADSRFTKKVDSYVALQRESSKIQSLSEETLKFTLCDRDNLSDKKGNYFMSFNLPFKTSQFPTASRVSEVFPELQQLNVDQIIITPISANDYSEFIDGRTVTMRVPVSGSSNPTLLSGVTLVSSTYTAVKPLKYESNILLGDNIVFLFSDDINKPYSGKTVNELGDAINNSTVTSWDPTGEYKIERVLHLILKLDDSTIQTKERMAVMPLRFHQDIQKIERGIIMMFHVDLQF